MPSVFTDALLASPLPVIMEVKRKDGNDVDLMGDRTIPEVVADYTAAGAPCISVVTGRWFGGDEQMLVDVAGLTDLPLLKKDFITRESQVVAAKETGASAILLTARILPKSSFQKLIEITLRNGVTPFVEVADHEELESVVHPEDCIVAINNKDIRNQERDGGDLDLSRDLLAATIADRHPVPRQRERDQRPEDRGRAGGRRLQGAADRCRPAAERQRSGLGRRLPGAPPEAGRDAARRAGTGLMATIGEHVANHASSTPDASALVWDGALDQLRRAAGDGGERRRGAGRARPARRPAGRDPRAEVARRDRARSSRASQPSSRSCCRRSSSPPRRSTSSSPRPTRAAS